MNLVLIVLTAFAVFGAVKAAENYQQGERSPALRGVVLATDEIDERDLARRRPRPMRPMRPRRPRPMRPMRPRRPRPMRPTRPPRMTMNPMKTMMGGVMIMRIPMDIFDPPPITCNNVDCPPDRPRCIDSDEGPMCISGLTCANVRCMSMTVCIDDNRAPECLPYCGGPDNIQCDDGLECNLSSKGRDCDPLLQSDFCFGFCEEAENDLCANVVCPRPGSTCVDGRCTRPQGPARPMRPMRPSPSPLTCASVTCFQQTTCVESADGAFCAAFCGGIAGTQCRFGFGCVDDPFDECDPLLGGADCGGLCVPLCGDQACDIGSTCLRGMCIKPASSCAAVTCPRGVPCVEGPTGARCEP